MTGPLFLFILITWMVWPVWMLRLLSIFSLSINLYIFTPNGWEIGDKRSQKSIVSFILKVLWFLSYLPRFSYSGKQLAWIGRTVPNVPKLCTFIYFSCIIIFTPFALSIFKLSFYLSLWFVKVKFLNIAAPSSLFCYNVYRLRDIFTL